MGFQVTFNLENSGTRAGAEVAQVYLLLPGGTNEVKRLVGWQKVSLAGSQLESVTISVNANDSSHPLTYWNATNHAWTIASGTYTVYLGNSSASPQQVGTFQMP